MGLSFGLGFSYVRYKKKELLVESSMINYAWGLVYIGEAILDDGTIYEWDTTKTKKNYGDIKQKKDWILRNGKVKKEKVNEEDLERLKKLIGDLEDIVEKKEHGYVMYDGPSNYTSVWKNNEEITIYADEPEYLEENTTKEADEIMEIIKKY